MSNTGNHHVGSIQFKFLVLRFIKSAAVPTVWYFSINMLTFWAKLSWKTSNRIITHYCCQVMLPIYIEKWPFWNTNRNAGSYMTFGWTQVKSIKNAFSKSGVLSQAILWRDLQHWCLRQCRNHCDYKNSTSFFFQNWMN